MPAAASAAITRSNALLGHVHRRVVRLAPAAHEREPALEVGLDPGAGGHAHGHPARVAYRRHDRVDDLVEPLARRRRRAGAGGSRRRRRPRTPRRHARAPRAETGIAGWSSFAERAVESRLQQHPRSVLEERVAVLAALVGELGDRHHALVVVVLDLVELRVHPAAPRACRTSRRCSAPGPRARRRAPRRSSVTRESTATWRVDVGHRVGQALLRRTGAP